MLLVMLALALAGPEVATKPVPVDHSQHVMPAKWSEKKICKRDEATESRMESRRICKTAAQWKRERDGVGSEERQQGVASRSR